MGVKFGIFDYIERRRDMPLDHQYRDRLEWVAQAEQAGFHCYHVAKHHQSPLCLAPNQAVYLADTGEEAAALRSLALFAREVMPHFVDAPVSASTEYCRSVGRKFPSELCHLEEFSCGGQA
jgi:hypothetical protein